MLKVLYRTVFYAFTIDATTYETGQIVTFCGNRIVTICTSKDVPCGFLLSNSENNEQHPSVSIASLIDGEFITDMFESSEYHVNDFLYCSDNGRFSNETRYKGNVIIGIVNAIYPENEIGLKSMFTRGLEDIQTSTRKIKIPEPTRKIVDKSKLKFMFLDKD